MYGMAWGHASWKIVDRGWTDIRKIGDVGVISGGVEVLKEQNHIGTNKQQDPGLRI